MSGSDLEATKAVRSTASGGGSTLVHLFGIFPQLRVVLDRIDGVDTTDPGIDEYLEYLAVPRVWREWINTNRWKFSSTSRGRLDISVGDDVVIRVRNTGTRHPSDWIQELQRDFLRILTENARIQKKTILVEFHCPNCPDYTITAEWGTRGLTHRGGCGAHLEQEDPKNWTAFVPPMTTDPAPTVYQPTTQRPEPANSKYGSCQCCGIELSNIPTGIIGGADIRNFGTGIVGMIWSNKAHAWVVEFRAKGGGSSSEYEEGTQILLCQNCADKFQGTVYMPKGGIAGLEQCPCCFRPHNNIVGGGLVQMLHGNAYLHVCGHCAEILAKTSYWEEGGRAKGIFQPDPTQAGLRFVWNGVQYIVGITAYDSMYILLRNSTLLGNIAWLNMWPPQFKSAVAQAIRMHITPEDIGNAAKTLGAAIAVPVNELEYGTAQFAGVEFTLRAGHTYRISLDPDRTAPLPKYVRLNDTGEVAYLDWSRSGTILGVKLTNVEICPGVTATRVHGMR